MRLGVFEWISIVLLVIVIVFAFIIAWTLSKAEGLERELGYADAEIERLQRELGEARERADWLLADRRRHLDRTLAEHVATLPIQVPPLVPLVRDPSATVAIPRQHNGWDAT